MDESAPLLSLPDEAATAALGAAAAQAVRAAGLEAVTILLSGELGAGKTTFARGFLRALGHEGPVPSPTYTLIEPYRVEGRDVHHVDLYRLTDPQELEYLGWRDLAGGIALIEWPERSPALTAAADLEVTLALAPPGRRAALAARSRAGRRLLARIESRTA